jgi:SAM-dependent methyltransferase
VYDQYWTSGDHYEPSQTFAEMIERLQALRSDIRVADLGCGIGRHALYAAARGASVVAVDHSEQALLRLRERAEGLPIEAVHGDIVAWAERNAGSGLDGLVCFDAIHHVAPTEPQVVGALRTLAGTVRPGGMLLVTLLSDIDYGLGGAPDGRLLVSADEAERLLDGAFRDKRALVGRRSEVRFDNTVNLDPATGALVATHYQATRVIRLFEV